MPLPNISIEISEQEKILKNLQEILNNDKIDWSQRYRDFKKAQCAMVDKYGREGLMMLLDSETRVFVDSNTKRSREIMHYSEMREDCPWFHLRSSPVKQVIEQVWESFAIDVMDALIEKCDDLLVIFEAGKWYLIYPFLAKDYDYSEQYEFLAGREPEPNAALPKNLVDAGWRMPEDLKDFYCAHGNFGGVGAVLSDSSSQSICSVAKLELSLAFLEEEHRKKWGVDYSFLDLLTFYEDGGGNSQNFYKVDPVGGTYITVDWDHETKQISGGAMLEEFMEYIFCNRLRGEW